MIFPSRRKAGPDRYLDWKVWIFFAGAALALAGIGMESSVLVGLAVPVLLGGLALRFLPGGDRGAVAGEDGDDGGSLVDDGEAGEEDDDSGEGEDP